MFVVTDASAHASVAFVWYLVTLTDAFCLAFEMSVIIMDARSA